MKTMIANGLAVTALVTTLGTSLLLLDGQQRTLASSPETVANAEVSETVSTQNSSEMPSSAISVNSQEAINNSETPDSTQFSPRPQAETAIATIIPHSSRDSRLAATLRIRNLPVLTLLGTVEELKAFSPQSANLDNGVMAKAQAIADQLNQLAQNKDFDASSISVVQDKRAQAYSIQIAGEELIRLDRNTVLPGQTKLSRQAALQVTNNLRRLMGNAEPLTTLAKTSLSPTDNILNQPNLDIQDNSSTRQRIRSGIASWYGPGFHGRRTANGERYNQHSYTAAHKSLPFGTQVLVTNIRTGRSITVRINDRGPFVRGRVIDLSASAAKAIGVYGTGTAPVALEIIGR